MGRHTTNCEECASNDGRSWPSDLCQGLLQVLSPVVSPPWLLQQPFLPTMPIYARLLLLLLLLQMRPSMFIDKARVCPTSHQMQKARFPRLRTEYRVTAKTEGAILGQSIQKRECSPSDVDEKL